jgi:hypothetical protein
VVVVVLAVVTTLSAVQVVLAVVVREVTLLHRVVLHSVRQVQQTRVVVAVQVLQEQLVVERQKFANAYYLQGQLQV